MILLRLLSQMWESGLFLLYLASIPNMFGSHSLQTAHEENVAITTFNSHLCNPLNTGL